MIAALLWVVLAILLAVTEVLSGGTLVLLMFAAGAMAAAVAAGLGVPVLAQAVVFAAVSALSVWVLRPIIKKHMIPAIQGADERIGVKALEGASGVVLEQVTGDSGRIKVEGEFWTARVYDATQVIEPGERVRVMELRGTTALVWRDELADMDITEDHEAKD